MPKYFEGDIGLPADVVNIHYSNGVVNGIESVQKKEAGRFCINVKIPGVPENSLGYFFIIEKNNDMYTVLDVKNIVHFRDVDLVFLTRIMAHASGIEFDFDIQNEFHRIRNEIGLD